MRRIVLITFLCALPTMLHAQQPASASAIEAGTRVRVWPAADNGAKVHGRVQSISVESLQLISPDTNNPRLLPLASLERIDVSRGRNRLGWTGLGMLAGAAAGVVISRADNDEGELIGGLDETAEGIGNTIAGALIGGIIGFFVAPERWRTAWEQVR